MALVITGGVYLFTSVRIKSKGKKSKKINWIAIKISSVIFVILLAIITFGAFATASQPDMQCTSSHTTTSKPVKSITSSNDYFLQGNYNYDIGNCHQAIADYTIAVQLNPNFAQAYNNRAYTNMRLQNYKDALPDLDKAIGLNSSYIEALMNRGDIHNYYYQINRQAAIVDYKRVIAITGPSGSNTSVCGHLFLAKHNGWTLGAYVGYLTGEWVSCK